MTVEDMIKELQKCPMKMEVAIKDYSGSSDMWSPKPIKNVSRLNHDDKILIS